MDDVDRLEILRWKGQATCPYCGSTNATPVQTERRHHCNNCNTSFSATTKTVLHGTRLSLVLWAKATELVLESGGKISARKLAAELGISKNTACQLSTKIQVAMHDPQQRMLLLSLIQ